MRNGNTFLDISVEFSRFQCLLLELPTEFLKKKAILQHPEFEDLITIYVVYYTFVEKKKQNNSPCKFLLVYDLTIVRTS